MIKKKLNQNDIYVQELIDTVEPKFIFSKDGESVLVSKNGW